MQVNEFKAWLEGFGEGMEGPPSEVQWKKINKKINELDDEITYRYYRDQYWEHPWGDQGPWHTEKYWTHPWALPTTWTGTTSGTPLGNTLYTTNTVTAGTVKTGSNFYDQGRADATSGHN